MTAAGIPALLEPIQERLNAATPGPWEVIDFHEGFRRMEPLHGVVNVDPRKPVVPADKQLTVQLEEGEREDAVFIAHAPTDTARLLAAVKAVDSILSQALTMISADPDVSEYERGFDDSTRGLSAKLRSAVEAALRGEA